MYSKVVLGFLLFINFYNNASVGQKRSLSQISGSPTLLVAEVRNSKKRSADDLKKGLEVGAKKQKR